MTVSISAVEQYLYEVKAAIRNNRYIIARNSKRQDNLDLFSDYIMKVVGLYIKFNKLENKYVIVVSFHEQKHPLTYYFK